ncbi:uncharacterized protein FPRO_07030 [Fusarium proliferatum ET1]|uniref:BZIP domain-containing protein n=1 Tax=Fusarium proliferatum (strain ET1) TaxID=1227346 RepID=A0A1L7VAK3_FUSPR|nr:uncharacterized protein FPRO_07030 [Fusarium proliferatum ET1]CZR37779.1 uncharacterized protein FPRO_07030 [Fusarium proliferatum ET1]
MSDPQKIAIEPMAQQLLVQKPGEDWTGVTSTAQRRKLQNRLNKRSQYLRKRQQQEQNRLASNIVGQAGLPAESMPSIALALQGPPDAMFEVIRRTCEVYERPDKSERVFAVACKTYMDYTMNAPRISQLPLLISLNVTIAVANNATVLGFDRALMCIDEAISPFNINGPFNADYNPPKALEPTEVQKAVLHHPWLDIFPFPKFRDNVILAADAELLDDGELCEDISEINWENVEKPSLIVWGDSSVPNSWEASPWFLRKWGEDPILLPGDEDATTIWIHNDNAAEKFPGTIGHYSGLAFKEFVIYGEDDTSDAGADEPNALVPGDHVDE